MADNTYNFEASARIPVRPLSYDNKDLAKPKELIIDYKNRKLYICDANGVIADATGSSEQISEKLEEALKEDPSVVTSIMVKIPETYDPETGEVITEVEISISDAIYQIFDKFNNLSADEIKETDDKQFVSAEDKESWSSKTDIYNIDATIPSGTANWTSNTESSSTYYTQNVTVENILESDYPVIGIKLSDSYTTVIEELDSYSYIYKILTYDGYIKVYATNPTTVDLNITIKVDR